MASGSFGNAQHGSLMEMAADIVSAYVSNNAVPASELPTFIRDIHSNLEKLAGGIADAPIEKPRKEPAIAIKKSVTPDFIVCFEDGKKFKSLKRHLATAFGMSPQEYRAKWGLPHDYPMVAPNYSTTRSALAKQAGLGQKPEAVQSKISVSNASAPGTTAPPPTASEITAADFGEAKAAEPEAAKSKAAKPRTTKPRAAKPKTTKKASGKKAA